MCRGHRSIWDAPDAPAMRARWFRDRDGVELVGLDISSSVTQILALLLGLRRLEGLASPPTVRFNQRLVTKAERLQRRTLGPLGIFKDGYTVDDPYLRAAVKDAWMTRNYGAATMTIVRKQRKEPWTFGPGWTGAQAVTLFLRSLPWYRSIAAYDAACGRLAEVAYRADPCAGVTFIDPFHRIPIRWNPIGFDDEVVQS